MKKTKNALCVISAFIICTSISGCDSSDQLSDSIYVSGAIIDQNGNVVSEGYSSENDKAEAEDNVFTSDINVDILSRHLLPSFERMQEDERVEYVESLQVYRKISGLGIDTNVFLFPEINLMKLSDTLDPITQNVPEDMESVDFTGNTSEMLQSFLLENIGKVINILSSEILVNSQIDIPSNTCIQGNGVTINAINCERVFVVEDAENIVLEHVNIYGGADYGVFVRNSKNITVSNCEICELSQKAICVTDETNMFCIKNNYISHNSAGGIYCSGNVSNGIIAENVIVDNYGTSNWMAGIVLTSVTTESAFDIWETFDDAHHFPAKENLVSQVKCPHSIIIEGNEVNDNNASGIYSDGAYSCYVLDNDVKRNDKEGICLDYGTIGFYLKNNLFDGNGQRMRQTDEDLRMDFVLDAGRMSDGSAKSKLPGVSIDNAAYNILENNIVSNNYGGGIKMVRTGIRNLIFENIVKNNNVGQNDAFHFFGIELGSAVADVEAADMDFTPDFENILCRNIISGNHYSGVFIGENCYVNDVFDNVIMEPQMFAVEAISTKFNSIINNFSGSAIRNEYRG